MSSDVVRAHLRNGEWELARVGAEQALHGAPEPDRGVLYALLARALLRLGRPRAPRRRRTRHHHHGRRDCQRCLRRHRCAVVRIAHDAGAGQGSAVGIAL